MYKNKTICAIVPAYNEETQIGMVIDTMPDFVDKIVIIDDCSKDKTVQVVTDYMQRRPDVLLLRHEVNQGVGAAIASGYKWARDNNVDVAVVMAGDGQMAPADLPAILDPVVEDKADYSKGNRLFTGEAYKKIPKIRYFGNSVLSLLTKIASGYWNIADSQSGYTAINAKALRVIDWDAMYKGYGQPNDLLVRLNINNFRVKDVQIQPVYNIGEKSGIKIRKVLFTISWILFKMFLKRMKEKYIIRDFHPLVFFYACGFFFGLLSFLLFLRIFYFWFLLGLDIPKINAMAALFSFMSSTQFTLFAMWFDMEANKELR
ncbi:MAG TPA: glycosyltransferase family 2 protein [bacterium]|nr:glycosyltransferase family 2 protein [bacterium]HPN44927.1 glycosyltransferase family 2 protein [bacterium]